MCVYKNHQVITIQVRRPQAQTFQLKSRQMKHTAWQESSCCYYVFLRGSHYTVGNNTGWGSIGYRHRSSLGAGFILT